MKANGMAAMAAVALTLGGEAQAQEYPYRDITNAVVWGAGGGTDTINRMIMAEMEKELPIGISVVNQTGGVAGSNGMVYVMNQPADGYTLAGISESNVTASVQGGWDNTFDVWYPFIVGGSPDLISVPADSEYETLEQLVQAATENGGTIPAAASGAGSIHHLNLLALEEGTGATFRFVPYGGSGPAQEAALAGEVEVIVTSLAEQAPLIEGGELRPLAMLTGEPRELAGETIPSAFEMYPSLTDYLPLKQAIGFAVQDEAPQEVKDTLSQAFETAMQSDTVKEWAEQNYYDLSGRPWRGGQGDVREPREQLRLDPPTSSGRQRSTRRASASRSRDQGRARPAAGSQLRTAGMRDDEKQALRVRDFWTALVLIGLSLFFLWRTSRLPFFKASAAGVSAEWFNSAALVPYGIFAALLGLGLSLLAIAVRDGGAPRLLRRGGPVWRPPLASVAAGGGDRPDPVPLHLCAGAARRLHPGQRPRHHCDDLRLSRPARPPGRDRRHCRRDPGPLCADRALSRGRVVGPPRR